MNGPEVFIVVILFAGLLIRLAAGSLDRLRVKSYIASRRGELLSIRWHPFGPGFFGEKDSRIYQVRYRDEEGCVHDGYVKTSMLCGVYFTEDQIVSPPHPQQRQSRLDAPQPTTPRSVEEEKAQLRKRLRELEELD